MRRISALALIGALLAGCQGEGAPGGETADPAVAEGESAAPAGGPGGMRVTADTQVVQLPQEPVERP